MRKDKIAIGIFAAGMIAFIVAVCIHNAYTAVMSGPVVGTNADVTLVAATASVTPNVIVPQSTPVPPGVGVNNRVCVEIDWISGSSVRVGDANISASQGIPIAAATGAGKTICADGPIYGYGIGGTAVVAPNELRRQ